MLDEDTISPDAPAQDTSTVQDSASTADTPQTAAPESQDAQPAADSGTEQDDAPSTTGQPVADPNKPAEPSVDWQDRYKNLQSYADRRHQGYEQHLTKMQQELQTLRQSQEKAAQQAQLKPWSKQHPENAKFNGLIERSKAIHKQLQAADRLPPEQRQGTIEAIMAGVSPEEQGELAKYREEREAFQGKFFSDPEETMAPLIERGVQQAMQKVMQDMQGRQQVDRDFSQPHLKPILENPQYASYLNERLARGVPYADAMEMLKLRAATDLMHKRLNGSERQTMHAQEQSRLVRGRAANTISADPAAAPSDPYQLARKEAAKQGIMPGTAAFNKLIDRFTAV